MATSVGYSVEHDGELLHGFLVGIPLDRELECIPDVCEIVAIAREIEGEVHGISTALGLHTVDLASLLAKCAPVIVPKIAKEPELTTGQIVV